jgi:septum formation protein
MFHLPKIYLASQSPRRRELLDRIGVEYALLSMRVDATRGADVDEQPLAREAPADYVQRIATVKASVAWGVVLARKLERRPVLAADTTVCIDDHILGKPIDSADAMAMLRRLSGREHRVLTCVSIRLGDQRHAVLSENTVRFRPIEEEELERYVQSGEPMDKAGAYAIQGLAQAFIPGIVGSYSGVMGLPLCETVDLLKLIANDSRPRAAR